MVQGKRSKGALNAFAIVLEIDGNFGGLRGHGRQGVNVGGLRVDGMGKTCGGEIGKANADGIAMCFSCQIAHEDAADEWGRAAFAGEGAGISVDPSASDIRVEAGAAHIFADIIDNQEVNFLEGQAGHQSPRLFQKRRFARFDLSSGDELDGGGFVALVFQDRDAAKDGRIAQHNAGKVTNDAFMAKAGGGDMHGSGAFLFTEADDGHFDQAASDGPVEIGMGFDAIDENDVIGAKGFNAAVDWSAALALADLADFHRGADFSVHGGFGHAVGGEQFCLAAGAGAAVAAHRRKDKRLGPGGAKEIESGADDFSKVGDAAASHADGDGRARFELRKNRSELRLQQLGDPERRRGREVLADARHFREWKSCHGSLAWQKKALCPGRARIKPVPMRRAIPFLVLFICVATLHAQAPGEEAKLETFFKKYLEEQFALRPTEATGLGDHRFDNQLDDVSKAARAKWVEHDRQTLKNLRKEIRHEALTRPAQIDYEIFEHDLERGLWSAENTKPFEEDPRTYGGYLNDSVYSLLTQSTLPKETNIANCIARMAKIPAVVAAARESLTKPPKQLVETAIRQNRGAIGFYEKDIFELAGNTPQLEQLKQAAAPVVVALKQHQEFLEKELLPRATGDWRLGKKKFYKKLEMVLDAGMTADQVLADAESEFSRVEAEMYVISRQLWSKYFPGKPLPPDDKAGRGFTIRTVINAVNQEHGEPSALITDARATVERIKKFIRERDILTLPEPDHCAVIEMPEFKRGNSIAYLENAPPLDPSASTLYAISPPPADWDAQKVRSFLEEYNQHMLQILTIHEAYPGHFVQLEYSNRTPSLIRRLLGSGVYIEGWAVYTEQMMLDQGYGEGDLRLRLMQLKFYLRAVGNAILDHKMHCANMSDDEALHFLMDDVFQAEGEARLKVIRSKQSSTQLSTYFVGRMAHYRLRQQMEREMGEKFNLGRFHEAVIGQGSIPVKYLPEVVRATLSQPAAAR